LAISIDPSIHAVQWYGEFGEIEYRSVFDGSIITKPQNETITGSARFQSVLDVWSLAHEEAMHPTPAPPAATDPTPLPVT
jgi:hypothetical protein